MRRDGLHLFGIRYWDDVRVRAGRHQRPMRVAPDPRDLSKVYLRGPDEAWRPIRFANLCRPPITLWELRRAQATLKERGLALVDEALVIFENIERQRALVEEASRRTKEARRLMERRERALAGSAAPAHSGGSEGSMASTADDPPIDFSKLKLFPVEEWS